jgi:16S rRNA processing protein RimM
LPERLVVGRIAKAHGIKGEVAVDVYSDAPDRFVPGARLFAGDDALTISAALPHHERLLVLFDEIADRSAAEALHGVELTIPASEAHALGEWSFYPHQLSGLSVIDEAGRSLGTMVRVDESPANDIWVVRSGDKEVLVPAVRDIVVSVDLGARTVVLRPPEGLF